MDPTGIGLAIKALSIGGVLLDAKAQEATQSTVDAILLATTGESTSKEEDFTNILKGLVSKLYWATVEDLKNKAINSSSAGNPTISAISSAIKVLSPEYQARVKAAIYKRFGNYKKANPLLTMANNIKKKKESYGSSLQNELLESLESVEKSDNFLLYAGVAIAAGVVLLLARR